jgi:hypothetical protein
MPQATRQWLSTSPFWDWRLGGDGRRDREEIWDQNRFEFDRGTPGIDEEAPKCVTQTIASHVGKVIYPRLAGFAVDQHEAVAIPAGRDAVAIADVHAHNIKRRFGQSQEFTMMPAFEVNDVADGQKRVSGVFDFDPSP